MLCIYKQEQFFFELRYFMINNIQNKGANFVKLLEVWEVKWKSKEYILNKAQAV